MFWGNEMISVWGNKKLGGYPGLTHTAKQICEYIPQCKIYVEPFAGLGRTSHNIKAEKIVLNDKSPYAFDYLTKHFNAEITNLDFEESIRLYDSEDTFFLFDPPWMTEIYQGGNDSYCDRTDIEYYQQIMDILPNLKADWILVCGIHKRYRGSTLMRKSNYYLKELESPNKPIFGKKARVLLASNKPFKKYTFQSNLTVQTNCTEGNHE